MSACTVNCCPTVNCNDNYSILIQALLNLGAQQPQSTMGFTVSEIEAEVPNVCVAASMDVGAVLLAGVRRGIFGYGIANSGIDNTYMVRSDMVRLNNANAPYWRGPGCPGSFYAC